MVGNKPHLGRQKNIMVRLSLNCCCVNKRKSHAMRMNTQYMHTMPDTKNVPGT